MLYTIREFSETDKAPIANIVKEVWGEKSLTKFNLLHPWFRRRSLSALDGSRDLILEGHGKVVGYVRIIPCEYLLAGKRIKAGYFTDFVTSPDSRGSGVKLARHLVSTPDFLWVGTPIARVGRFWPKIIKRDVKIKPIERAVLLLSPAVFIKAKGVPSLVGAPIDVLWQFLLRRKLKKINDQKSSATITLSEESTLPSSDEIDDLFNAFAKDFYAIAVRDREFFNWRFSEAPNNYRYLWVRSEGRLVGYTVYREGSVSGRKTILIVETMAIGEKTNCYGAMLNSVCQYGLKNGFADVQTLTSGCSSFNKVLQQLGAVLKEEDVNLIASLRSEDPRATEMFDGKEWFLSMAEADHEFVMFK
jgi:hypothetical protein